MRTIGPRDPGLTDSDRVLLAEARLHLRGALLALAVGTGVLAWALRAGWM